VRRSRSLLAPLALLALLAFAGAAAGAENPALTHSDDGVHFRNDFFAARITKPASWYSQNVEEQIMLQQRGKKMLAQDDKNFKGLLDAAIENLVPMFTFFEKPPGTPGVLNPSVVGLAENIKLYPGVTDGCDYLAAVKHTASLGQMDYAFGDDCGHRSFGDTALDYVDATLTVGKIKAHQRYFATVRNGYAIGLIQTWFNAEGEAATEKVVATFRLGD